MTMTLQQLGEEVLRQQNAKRDLVAPTPRISLLPLSETDTTPLLVLDGRDGVEEFPVKRFAHQQIAQAVDVPWKHYERLMNNYPVLLCDHVSALMAQGPKTPGKMEKKMIRVLDGEVRAVLSDGYRRRDNVDLLQHLLPVFNEFPGVEFKRCDLTDQRLYIKTFWPGREREITTPYAPGSKVGDVVRQGVVISNSEVGAGSLYVYPYTDVLACRNGMVHEKFGQRRVHLGKRVQEADEVFEYFSDETVRLDDAAFFAKTADTLRACLSEAVFDAITQEMQDLANIAIPGSPVGQVEALANKHSFTGEEGEGILQHLIGGGDLSAWGYVNAITATARELDPGRQTELEMIAGRLTSESGWAKELAAA